MTRPIERQVIGRVPKPRVSFGAGVSGVVPVACAAVECESCGPLVARDEWCLDDEVAVVVGTCCEGVRLAGLHDEEISGGERDDRSPTTAVLVPRATKYSSNISSCIPSGAERQIGAVSD